jgi:cytochrome c peroxidase
VEARGSIDAEVSGIDEFALLGGKEDDDGSQSPIGDIGAARDRARSRLRCRWAWAALMLVLLAAGPAPDPQILDAQPVAGEEPITPVPAPPAADPLRLALGEQLFQDRRLSHDNRHACLSCHDIHSNGADGKTHDVGRDGTQLRMNTNTVFDAALSFRLNWEGNYRTLEQQAEASLTNPKIMGTSVDEILGRLRADPETVRQFGAAYGHGPDRTSLLDAIATYERSLLTPGSRFDRWLRGDASALSPEEQHGYQLFKSLGCISCHQGVNVGGNLFERHGIFHRLAAPTPALLRVPSLRNVAETPPYFHDGSAPTLADAVQRMGAAQLDQPLQKPQIDAIIAFLNTLTGTYRGAPVVAPPP